MSRREKEFCFKTNKWKYNVQEREREKRIDTVHLGFLKSCKIDTCLFKKIMIGKSFKNILRQRSKGAKIYWQAFPIRFHFSGGWGPLILVYFRFNSAFLCLESKLDHDLFLCFWISFPHFFSFFVWSTPFYNLFLVSYVFLGIMLRALHILSINNGLTNHKKLIKIFIDHIYLKTTTFTIFSR